MSDDKCASYFSKILDYVHGVGSSKKQSACPHKQKKYDKDNAEKDGDKESEDDDKEKSSKKSYVDPSQELCPPSVRNTCCYIKMQDPCRPCCCEPPLPPPCPPKGQHREPRDSVCGCDLCQRHPGHKCCEKDRAFRGIRIDGDCFEKA